MRKIFPAVQLLGVEYSLNIKEDRSQVKEQV